MDKRLASLDAYRGLVLALMMGEALHLCGIAGALYVPQVGIINPGEMSPANSIEIAIWAAVGGRATLIGPIVGAFIVNGAKSWLTVSAPEFWLYFLGALFIGFTPAEAGAIGIIGGADGPTAIFLASKLAEPLLGPIAIAAYSYMALVPVIQPPIMKLLTTRPSPRCMRGPNVLKMRAMRTSTLS